MFNLDMSEFVGVFLDEAHEVLALLESDVLQLERGNDSPELLQSIFRAAHTLKGSSRSMGFGHIGDLTHEMENVLDKLREGKLPVSTPLVDALLDCLDALNTLIESVATQKNDENTGGRNIPALVVRLGELLEGADEIKMSSKPARKFELQAHESAAVADARAAGLSVFRVAVSLDPKCLMKGVRLMMVLSALDPICTLIASSVSDEEMEEDTFGDTVELVVAGEASMDDIDLCVSNVSEVSSTAISHWSDAPRPAAPVTAVVELTEHEAAKSIPSTALSTTVRIDVGRLDSLLNLVGELVIDRTQLARLAGELKGQFPRDSRVAELLETTHRLARTTAEMQDEIMKSRMLPVDGVFGRMPRMVRDLAQKSGKEIDFQISGGGTEMDRSILEILADPIIHLLRNSLDHGIEMPDERVAAGKPRVGTITLNGRHEGGGIIIEVTDDGRGMNPVYLRESAVRKGLISESAAAALGDRDALNLIFTPGFSTAAVLSDVSGRGVGMDIVRSNLERVGGRIGIASTVGQGSQFTIYLPLTLAIVHALLVRAGGSIHVIPLSSVVETLRLDHCGFNRSTVSGRTVLDLRGQTVPLVDLNLLLEGDPRATSPDMIPEKAHVVVVGVGQRQVGLCVDSFAGEQEVVIKSLGKLLGDVPGLTGAAIIGDGRVALVVDAVRAVQSIVETGGARPVLGARASAW